MTSNRVCSKGSIRLCSSSQLDSLLLGAVREAVIRTPKGMFLLHVDHGAVVKVLARRCCGHTKLAQVLGRLGKY